MSIIHRATGMANALGALTVAAWLWSISLGEAAYLIMYGMINSWVGVVLLALWTVCLSYHLCNGLRHLIWDAGRGLEIGQAYRLGWLVLSATVVIAALVWLIRAWSG